jgi:hypothetical protein
VLGCKDYEAAQRCGGLCFFPIGEKCRVDRKQFFFSFKKFNVFIYIKKKTMLSPISPLVIDLLHMK